MNSRSLGTVVRYGGTVIGVRPPDLQSTRTCAGCWMKVEDVSALFASVRSFCPVRPRECKYAPFLPWMVLAYTFSVENNINSKQTVDGIPWRPWSRMSMSK